MDYTETELAQHVDDIKLIIELHPGDIVEARLEWVRTMRGPAPKLVGSYLAKADRAARRLLDLEVGKMVRTTTGIDGRIYQYQPLLPREGERL